MHITVRNTAFDAMIAEKVYGWKPCPVPKDYYGENECEVLTSNGKHPFKGYEWPPVGKLHRGAFCPKFTTDLRSAINFANFVGLRFEGLIPLTPRTIAERAFKFFEQLNLPAQELVPKSPAPEERSET